MALRPLALLRLVSHQSPKLRPRNYEACRAFSRSVRDSCAGRTSSPCAPCEPGAGPACRASALPSERVLHVTCCAPPRRSPPPCPPQPPPCALNCDYSSTVGKRGLQQLKNDKIGSSEDKGGTCGALREHVAARHEAAERARRQDYEQEAARPRAAPAAPTHRDDPPLASSRCGSSREPPPPRLEELPSHSQCHIRDRPSVDPCARRPRVVVDIDRGEPKSEPAPSLQPMQSGIPKPHSPRPKESASIPSATGMKKSTFGSDLKSRILRKLGAGESNCKSSSKVPKTVEYPRWCASPPRPAPAPVSCREPSLAAQLRARRNRSPHSRGIHTSGRLLTTNTKVPDPDTKCNDYKKLAAVLSEKANYKEAGRGRVVACAMDHGKKRSGEHEKGEGLLELRVAPGAALRVLVSLDGQGGGCVESRRAHTSEGDAKACAGSDEAIPSTLDACNKWLSIQNIRKKFTDCRSGAPMKTIESNPRPKPPCVPDEPRNPCQPRTP